MFTRFFFQKIGVFASSIVFHRYFYGRLLNRLPTEKRQSLPLLISTILVIFFISGCGSGSKSSTPISSPNTIKVTYSKGPVSGATAFLYDEKGNEIAGPVTTNAGVARFSGVVYNGLVYTAFFGGSYTDEATGALVTLPTTFKIRSGAGSIGNGVTIDLVATPLTEIGFKRAKAATVDVVDLSTINAYIADVANEYGLSSIDLSAVPPKPLSDISGSSDADKYGIALVAISQELLNSDKDTPIDEALESYINTSAIDIDSTSYIAALNDISTNENTSNLIDSTLTSLIETNIETNGSLTIGGSITGLSGSLSLQNNDGEILNVTSNDNYIFASLLKQGDSYNVVILSQPQSQQCIIVNTSGVISSVVNNINITCESLFTVGGTVSGISTGSTLTLQNNGEDDIKIDADGTFTFNTSLPEGSAYLVDIKPKPDNLSCELDNATGLISSVVNDINVTCVSLFMIGGTVSGISTGSTLTLQNNGEDDIEIDADGTFRFNTSLPEGGTYSVSIKSKPDNLSCELDNATGLISSVVNDINVTCVSLFTVGGTVSGISTGSTLTLQNNGEDDIEVDADGTFTFNKSLPEGSAYSVNIKSKPDDLLCELYNVTGVVDIAITNIAVQCLPIHDITVDVTGLQGTLVLTQNETETIISVNGSHSIKDPLDTDVDFTVNITDQPQGQICDIAYYRQTSFTSNTRLSAVNLDIHCVSVLNKLGELASGDPQQIATSGDFAYVGTPHGIYIFNVSDPNNFIPAGYIGKFAIADIAISGNYLYAAVDEKARMVVVDISDPNAAFITSIQYRDTYTFSSSLTVSGNYVYLLEDRFTLTGAIDKLVIYDISTPSDPKLMGQLRQVIGGDLYDGMITVSGNYAYVAAAVAGFRIIDISNPTEPTPVARVAMSELNNLNNLSAHSVTVSGQYAYLSCDKDLFIFDISDPTNPVQVALYENIRPSITTIIDNNAYLNGARTIQTNLGVQTEYFLYVADMGSSIVPEFIASPATIAPYYQEFSINNDTLFLTTTLNENTSTRDGITILDISIPTNPLEIGSYEKPANLPRHITANGHLVVVADTNDGINIVDTTDASLPKKIGSYAISRVNSLKTIGNYVYVYPNDGPLNILDITDPQNPVLVGEYVDKYIKLFEINGNYIYAIKLGGGEQKLIVIDVSNPLAPVMISSLVIAPLAYKNGFGFSDVKYNNGHLYLSTKNGLMIIDVNDPGAPVLAGNYIEEYFSPFSLDVQGDFAYMCENIGTISKMKIIGISINASPSLINTIPTSCTDVAVSGNYVYISTKFGLRVYDVSEINNISEVARYNEPEMKNPIISIENNKVYLGQQGHGIVITDTVANRI